MFATVGDLLSRKGSCRLQDVVARSGVSIGSIYHRYGSREVLLARAFVDAVTEFQNAFLEALECGKEDAGERAAMATPRFCRSDPSRARILFCCRREEMLSQDIPQDLKDFIADNTQDAGKRIVTFARANDLSLTACRLGLMAYPLGAVRLYLPDQKIPKAIDAHVAAAYRAAVATKI